MEAQWKKWPYGCVENKKENVNWIYIPCAYSVEREKYAQQPSVGMEKGILNACLVTNKDAFFLIKDSVTSTENGTI